MSQKTVYWIAGIILVGLIVFIIYKNKKNSMNIIPTTVDIGHPTGEYVWEENECKRVWSNDTKDVVDNAECKSRGII